MTPIEKSLQGHEKRITEVEEKLKKIEPTVEFSKYFGRTAIVTLLGLVSSILVAVILKIIFQYL